MNSFIPSHDDGFGNAVPDQWVDEDGNRTTEAPAGTASPLFSLAKFSETGWQLFIGGFMHSLPTISDHDARIMGGIANTLPALLARVRELEGALRGLETSADATVPAVNIKAHLQTMRKLAKAALAAPQGGGEVA